jgi:hypothetical protein
MLQNKAQNLGFGWILWNNVRNRKQTRDLARNWMQGHELD